MAGVRVVAQTVEIPTGITTKTLLQILAAANHAAKLIEWSVSFDGISNVAAPIAVVLEFQTGTGSGGDVLTAKKMNPDDSEVVQTTALSNIDGSTQPSSGDEIMGEQVHPQGGYTWQAPFGGHIKVPGGIRIGIKVITPGADVNAKVRMVFEE